MRSTYLFERKKSARRAGKAHICPRRLRCRPRRISRAHSRSRAETNAFQRRRIEPTTLGDRQTDDPAPRLCGEPAPTFLALEIHRQVASVVGCQVRSGLRAGGSMDSNLYGAFPVKWSFLVFTGSLFGAGKAV